MSKLSDEKIRAAVYASHVDITLSDAIALTRAIEAAAFEAQPTDRRLINLLCRIHRDGGHYITEHGLDKAVEDADIRVAEQNAALDAQAKQEPVAWMHWFKYYDGTDVVRVAIGHCPKYNDQDPFRSEPLFAAPVVQPDMVMVPREPTEAMLDAAMNRYKHVSPEAK
ncbi:MAG TPA: hypothetical protein PLY42_13205, partial [Nitrospira sp.]|nr:hypothetical protein [Nitrospira sp.]